MKNSFILYHSYKKHLELLTNEQRGILFATIFDYSEFGIVPELEPVVKMAFNFIAEDIDINKQKWEDTVEARSEAGRKGAEARWKKTPKKRKKMAKDGNRILPMAKDGKNAVSVSVSDSESVNDSVSDSESNAMPISKDLDSGTTNPKPKRVQSIDILQDEEVVKELAESFGLSEVSVKGELEIMIDWLKSKGKKYKDYKAFARNWLRRNQKANTPGKSFESEEKEKYW